MRWFALLVCALSLALVPSLDAQQKPVITPPPGAASGFPPASPKPPEGGGIPNFGVAVAPDVAEPGSVEAIARFTTDARFISSWVAYVPDSKTVPSPTRFLGHIVGASGDLSKTSQIYAYFRALANATPRVRVETIGKSDEGRDILLVAIADEAGMRNLGRLKAATRALADPRKTSPAAAEALIESARPIYYFNAGLHSSESGSPEMAMELAYRLAVSDQPMIQAIRRNVVVLINPVSEPDGRDRFVEWFYRYLKGKTDYEKLPPTSPPYWGHYVYHDNNRDTHQKALETTRAVHRMFYEYHPTVVHDLHESIALLQTWNGTGPWNPNLDPIVISEFMEMSFEEVRAATSFGMPGVWTWAFGEGFGHHYMESVGTNHNAIGRGYETFGNATAETIKRTISNRKYLGRPVTGQEWYRPLPPPPAFTWSLRDNTNYMETSWIVPAQDGVAAALAEAARELAIDVDAVAELPDVSRHDAPLPRVGVWHTWADTQDVGWVRLTLDRQRIPYAYIRDDDIRAGGLKQKFDVIVYANTDLALGDQIHGLDTKFGPMAYTATPTFPSHGQPDASEDITGGIGWAGMSNLQQFLSDGGLLISLGNGSALPLEGGLVRGVSMAPGASSVWTPGAEISATFTRPEHPIAYGYARSTSVFRDAFPVYSVRRVDRGWIVLQWGSRLPKEERDEENAVQAASPKSESPKVNTTLVVSGGANGDDVLEGRPAILDMPAGKGRVIAFNFNPQHRDLNRSDYRLLWNAIINWKAILAISLQSDGRMPAAGRLRAPR